MTNFYKFGTLTCLNSQSKQFGMCKAIYKSYIINFLKVLMYIVKHNFKLYK